jgi:hypothetical protein
VHQAHQGLDHRGSAPAARFDRLDQSAVCLPSDGALDAAELLVAPKGQSAAALYPVGQLSQRVREQRQSFTAAGIGDQPVGQALVELDPSHVGGLLDHGA